MARAIQCFFKGLRKPCVVAALQDSDPSAATALADSLAKARLSASPSPPPVRVHVRPDDAAVHFDPLFEGFGEWTFWVAPRGCRDLKELHKKEATLFGIVVKKFRSVVVMHYTLSEPRLTSTAAESSH